MTYLAVSIHGSSIEQIRADLGDAIDLGADLIELRVDLMEEVSDDDIRSLREDWPAGVPMILTIRSSAEGGQWDGPDDERISRLVELGPVADYIDAELATWRRSANVRRKMQLALNRAGHISQTGGKEEIARAAKRKLILSRHDLTTRPPTLEVDLLAMLDDETCRVPKIVWRARTIRDNFEAFELMRQCPRPAIVICMGDQGLLSRLLARKFGAFATFAALSPDPRHATAPGQPPLSEVKELYRWDAIDADTRVYGVIADPVRHSLSPRVHNAAFAATCENAVYLPMQVAGGYESLKAFLVEVVARPWLTFRGFSVTLPHKENALRFLEETGGTIDPVAERIGAVNTLTLTQEGTLTGHNTDCGAALDAIREGLGVSASDLSSLDTAVLGAGGAARAVVAGLTDAGAGVTVYNRTPANAEALARDFGCRHEPWEDRLRIDAPLVVNCTSVGLRPGEDATPLPATSLRAGMTVFDTVYHPLQTRLLREAAERGCATIDGLTMFARQAAAQFQHWTGHRLPSVAFRRAAETCAGQGPGPRG